MTPEQSLLKAISFAAHKHRDQRRKGVEASPYINHPIQVAEILANVGQVTDVTTLVSAVLHDTIEDTDTAMTELVAEFGQEVADVVAEVSDDKTLSKQERKQRQVIKAPHLSDSAKLVKLADKICNVSDISTKPPENWDEARQREYFAWAEIVVDGCRGVNAELEAYFDNLIREL